MTKQEFTNFALNAGFELADEGSAYGLIGDYPVVIHFINGSAQLIFPFEKAQLQPAKNALKQALRQKAQFRIGSNAFVVVIRNRRKRPIQQVFAETANALIGIFKEYDIRPLDQCPYCSGGNCDSYAIVKNTYRCVHKHCIDEHLAGRIEATEKNELSGSYITGLIGGILGGAVGCIPTMLSLWFAETHYSILYALIPLGIYFGYKLLKGRMNRAVIITTIALSVFYAFALYILYSAAIIALYGYPISYLPLLLRDTQFLRGLLYDIAISFVFIALGIIIVWRRISHTNIREIAVTQNIGATVRPMNRYAYAPAVQQTQAENTHQ